MSATDLDVDANAEISYSLIYSLSDVTATLFDVTSDGGVIYSTSEQSLTPWTVIEMTIEASDSAVVEEQRR